MRVLYLDVYFLINFSVDLLAIYLSIKLLHIGTSVWRLCASAGIGAGYASGVIFLPSEWQYAYIPLSVLCLFLVTRVAGGRIHNLRRGRLCIMFVVFQMLLAGCVYYGYQWLDKLSKKYLIETKFQAENRKLLFFAVIVLLSIGVLRLFSALLGESRAESVCSVRVELFGRSVTVDALVDSGNLVRDPMDGKAVILVKSEVLSALSVDPSDLLSTDMADERLRKRIRLIPCHMGGECKLLYGIRADRICASEKGKNKENISALIGWDKEDGTYGGYTALVPSAVMER